MPRLFISHSSKDDLAAEAIRIHLIGRGWNRKDIFLDFSVEGISAHERWKVSLAEANSAANESRLADALGIIDDLRRHDGPRVFTIIAPSGVGKSSFLRAGLWPRLSRQSGVAPLVI